MVNNMYKFKLALILFGIISVSFAATSTVAVAPKLQPTASAPVLQTKNVTDVTVPNQQLTTDKKLTGKNLEIKSSQIDKVDRDADTMNSLKRQLELEKIRADISKVKNDSDKSVNTLGDTTVTSVYIDQNDLEHGKYATLQFVDGSTIEVEIGTRVDTYIVSDITMTGVTLSTQNCRKSNCKRTIKIGRLYAKNKDKDKDASEKDSYAATPVVNLRNDNSNLNSNSKDQMVPPIVTKG